MAKNGLKFTARLFKCKFVNINLDDVGENEGILPYGGSVYCQNDCNLDIKQCNFKNNVAKNQGGAIYAETRSIELNNNRFVDCSVGSGRTYPGYGSTVSLRQAVQGNNEDKNDYYEHVSGNVFINCHAKTSGGGLFVYCYDEHHTAKSIKGIDDENHLYLVYIQSCEFYDCKTEVEGGAICSGLMSKDDYDQDAGIVGDNDMHIDDCKFVRCESSRGGALYFQDGTKEGDEETLIEDCEFESCYANGTDHEGYAISCRSYQVSICNCDFKNHNIQSSGISKSILFVQTNEEKVSPNLYNLVFNQNNNIPSLIVSSIESVVISNSVFDESPLILNDSWNLTQVTFNSCQFLHNSGDYGGAISILLGPQRISKNNVITFNQCQFAGNTAKHGGSIYNNAEGQLLLRSCIFYNNSATENGGSICSSVYTEIINCNISKSSAPKGSAIYIKNNQNVKISNIALDIEKKPGQSAIFITGGNSGSILLLEGSGCFISKKVENGDKTPDFIEFDSQGSLQISGDMCFSSSAENSIKLPPGMQLNHPEWFNCNKCSPPPEWTPSYPPTHTIPTYTSPTQFSPTPSSQTPSSQTSFTQNPSSQGPSSQTSYPPSPTGDLSDSTTKSKSKLGTGAIAGIVIGCVAFIALIVLLILFLLRMRILKKARPTDVPSQEVDSNTFTNENPIWSEDADVHNSPMYSPSIDNPNNISGPEDPFMKEFEEGF